MHSLLALIAALLILVVSYFLGVYFDKREIREDARTWMGRRERIKREYETRTLAKNGLHSRHV